LHLISELNKKEAEEPFTSKEDEKYPSPCFINLYRKRAVVKFDIYIKKWYNRNTLIGSGKYF